MALMTLMTPTTSSASGFTLDIDVWSAPFHLTDRDIGAGLPEIEVRLRPGSTMLDFELSMDDFEVTPHAPWLGGSGVLVAVIQPDPAGGAGSSYFTEFAFGLIRSGMPVGAIRVGDLWKPVAKLTPTFHIEGASNRLKMAFAIPWSFCGGLHPLVDTSLGLNVTYVQQGGQLPRGRASLIADAATDPTSDQTRLQAGSDWRYGIPVHWRWPPEKGPAVHGRPVDLLLRQPHVELAPLALISTSEKPAKIMFVLRDRDGVIRLQTSWILDGPAGLRQRQGSLPADLPPGLAILGASYHDPAKGTTVSWQTDLISLPRGWDHATAGRIASLPAREKPSLQHRLDTVNARAGARRPLDNPLALGAMINEIEVMLDLFDRTGTTLPPGGNYLAVMPGRDGTPELLVSLNLPDGWRRGDPVHALLLLLRATDGQMQAVMQAPQLLAGLAGKDDAPPPAVVMAIPHLDERNEHKCDTAFAANIIDWLRDFLGCGPVHLAGVDLLAATVLEVAAARRDDLAGIFMITGMNFIPYPDDDAEALAARVSGLDPELPAGWVWFSEEQQPGDQAAALRRALQATGLRLQPSRTVQGGLTLDQAWQRALHWVVQPTP